jgi:hypothetical protein
MKPMKMIVTLVMILLFTITARISAQTFQYEWTNSFDGSEVDDPGYCLWHQIKGFYTYHVTIHVNPKTGFIEWVHNNILHYDLTDMVTGKKLVLIDTCHDSYNFNGNWYFWNWITGAELPISDNQPDEGTLIASKFSWISPGGLKVTMSTFYQLHRNALGEISVENIRTVEDCNPR